MFGKLLRILLCLASINAFAQEEATSREETPKLFSIHGELKAHYRWSEDSRFPLKFPFPPDFIPRGQTSIFERTV